MRASREVVKGLEHVLYNAHHRFTLQQMMLLAPLTPDDPDEIALLKQRLVARFVDILLAWRIYNYRSIDYSTMQYAMFVVMRDIRGIEPVRLAETLNAKLREESETFTSNSPYHAAGNGFAMHQQNRYAIHRMLARMTDHVETQSGNPSHFSDYVFWGRDPFEVEHVWANRPERHRAEFSDDRDFRNQRNRFGGLLLLRKSFNASYGDLPYRDSDPAKDKREHYNSQNLLARSLHPMAYCSNPGFLSFISRTHLPFHPHDQFQRADMEERCELYRHLAEHVWDPELLLAEVNHLA